MNYKKNMLTTFRVQGFNPATVQHHLHNDFNSLTTGLKEGFHVIRAKAFLPKGQGGRSLAAADLFQTFTQTFYYDAQTPAGVVTFPQNDGETVGGSSYEMVIRTDSTVEEVWFNIADSEAGNNDSATIKLNGNGNGFEPFTDTNQNGVRDPSETFTDLDGDGNYDTSIPVSWAKAIEVTSNPSENSPHPKEWRVRYSNIPASGSATLTFRLLEASSSRNFTLDANAGHYTTLVRTVSTAGPLERINIAWPQNDGDRVDDNYSMKVLFSKALAAGTTSEQLKRRFTLFTNGTAQGRNGWTVNYGDFGSGNAYHELSIPLPNLYNDLDEFLHELKVEYRFPDPDNRVLQAFRLVKASPSTKPFVIIVEPAEVGSDGRPVEIVIPDKPGPDSTVFTIRANTSASVTNLSVTGSPAIEILGEAYTDSNSNGKFDGEEPYIDANNNDRFDSGETFTDLNGNSEWDANEQPSLVDTNGNGTWDGPTVTVNGNTKTWDFPWKITTPGNYLITASTGGADPVVTTRNARVVLRETVAIDTDEFNDDDDDGLLDYDEATPKALPVGNSETWSNGDVHVHNAYGRSLPNTPDSDGDGLPDGLEVGWRTAANPPTDPDADTNGDGFRNFIGDLDPPLYAVVGNHGFVPGVGSQSQGDNRTRQAAGSVTDPTNPDSDGDGLPDGIEDANRNGWVNGDGKILPLNAGRNGYAAARPNAGDWPNNVIDSFETWTETSPTKTDSDGDGLNDGYGEDKSLDGTIDGDTNNNRAHDSGEAWTETDPLKADTDGDGLPDGWEVQYGLDPLDNGTLSFRTGGAGLRRNGPVGDPDNDEIGNLQELNANTNPTQATVIGNGGGEGTINIGTFSDWTHNDLLALDEYNEGGSQGADVYRTNGLDSSRDIVAFSFRDGGATAANGDGKVYFRIDFMDLAALAEQGELDAYIVIDTGNPAVGERALPDSIDIATDMRWEVVVAAYATNNGSVSVDTNRTLNTTTDIQDPNGAFGIDRRGIAANGLNAIAWSHRYDAVEIAVQRQALLDAGWLGDPATLNFQVFTTRDGTQNSPTAGPGDIGGRNDIRDTIGDDWLASDYWKDQDNIRLNGKLTSYFGRSSANDRGKSAKVMLLAHGNQAIQPASTIQNLVHNGAATNPTGYFRMLKTHEDHKAPLTLHITPTLASALQWAKNPATGAPNDGPALNTRIASLVAAGRIQILGSTFSDHVPKYFPLAFNQQNKALSENFLDSIYGQGAAAASRQAFWTPERVLDDETLSGVASLGYTHTFADQTRHLAKWFGRTSALGTDGFRINEVNGMKIIPIHDETSEYLDQTFDEGSAQPVRELLSRRSRSGIQDQVVVLWRDMADFATDSKATSYTTNVRWLSSRPWIRVVTAGEIIGGQVAYKGTDGNTYTNWGSVSRGNNRDLVQTAKDWIDHATQENYDNWYFGSANEQGLSGRKFGASTSFGQVGSNGHSNSVWQNLNAAGLSTGLGNLANSAFHGAMFQTAFHNTANNDLSKFSTGAYIYPDSDTGQNLADFARNSHAQARFANVYARVQEWAATATSATLGTEAVDSDLDGSQEYLLYNGRVFALFEAKGGRMTAAWMRHPSNGKIWQVAGNFASYSGTDSEDEGASNFVGTTTAISAYRTSGFKDWWTVDISTAGSNGGVNTTYSVSPAASGTGWTFTGGGVSKTIRIPTATSERLQATYQLSGLNKAFVRFGLSPDLMDLMIRGQSGLAAEQSSATRVDLTESGGDDIVRAFVEGPQINAAATDIGGSSFTTVLRRNQAQTHQVEVELNGAGPHTISLGFDRGPGTADADNDGLPDDWETEFGLSITDNGSGNIDNGPNGDPDKDGVLNRAEWLFGLNPQLKDSNQIPRLTVTPNPDGSVSLQFPTIPYRKYSLWHSPDLSQWNPMLPDVSTFELPVDPTHIRIDPAPAGNQPKRFYRLSVTDEP